MIKVINIESDITTSEGRRRNPRLFVGHITAEVTEPKFRIVFRVRISVKVYLHAIVNRCTTNFFSRSLE